MYKKKIRVIYEQLSPGYRRIADLMIDRYQDVAFMTAAEVGRAAQVDTALVVRFAQRLGYPGYPELIDDVQKDVKLDLRAVYEPPEGDNSPAQVFRRNLMQDRNDLNSVILHLDVEALLQAIDLLKKAHRILVAGEGSAQFLAEAFVRWLVVQGLPAHPISCELAGQAAITAHLRTDDLIVGIGMTSETPGVSVIMKVARDAGIKTVAIAGSVMHPITAIAAVVLLVPVRSIGSGPSWTAVAGMLHALAQAVTIELGEPVAEWPIPPDHFIKAYAETLQHECSGT